MEVPEVEEVAEEVAGGEAFEEAISASDAVAEASKTLSEADNAEARNEAIDEVEKYRAESRIKGQVVFDDYFKRISPEISEDPTAKGETGEAMEAVEEDLASDLPVVEALEGKGRTAATLEKMTPKIAKEFRKQMKNLIDGSGDAILDNFDKNGIDTKEFKDKVKKISEGRDKAKALKDKKIAEGVDKTQALAEYQSALDDLTREHTQNVEKLFSDPKVRTIMEKAAAEYKSTLETWLKRGLVLLVGGAVFGGLAGIYYACRELTGCWIYSNGSKAKLSCSNWYDSSDRQRFCSCMGLDRNVVGKDDVYQACKKAIEDDKDNGNAPPCHGGCLPVHVGGQTINATCTSLATDGIFYGYENVSPWDFVRDSIGTISQYTSKNAPGYPQVIAKFLQSLLYIVLAMVGIAILAVIGRYVYTRYTKKHSNFGTDQRIELQMIMVVTVVALLGASIYMTFNAISKTGDPTMGLAKTACHYPCDVTTDPGCSNCEAKSLRTAARGVRAR